MQPYEMADTDLVVQDHLQERTIHLQPAVILDETQLSEPVHEDVHSPPSCAYHLCKGFLTDAKNLCLGFPFFAIVGEP